MPLLYEGGFPKEVRLEAILEAREKRAFAQSVLLQKYSFTLLSYSLNIAGPVKRFMLGDRCFFEGKRAVKAIFKRLGLVPAHEIETDEDTGLEYLAAVDIDALKLKRLVTDLEERHPMGRLFDIDIIAKDGGKIDRAALGLPQRSCIICGKQGAGCARSRAHSLEELQARTAEIIEGFSAAEDARAISKNALRALLYEVAVTPKPGLVDRLNNGAHSDMDYFTFMDSAAALTPYFNDMATAGVKSRDTAPEDILRSIRGRGIEAEEEMFAATGGVNTHKGLIFSLGIICAAAGYLGYPYRGSGEILDIAARIAAPAFQGDLKNVTEASAGTHGEVVYARYGADGIRGEAARGFPSVREIALPALEDALIKGADIGTAGVVVLLRLMTKVCDTNIISRSSKDKLNQISAEISSFLEGEPDFDEIVAFSHALNSKFIADNISPGGCADLLAVTFMMHFMEELRQRNVV